MKHVLAAIGLFALTACGGGGADVSQAKEAAALAKQIQAKPDQADAILKEAGTDRAAFEALLYDIAADPDASRAYAEAL
jgi:hypothetical protein